MPPPTATHSFFFHQNRTQMFLKHCQKIKRFANQFLLLNNLHARRRRRRRRRKKRKQTSKIIKSKITQREGKWVASSSLVVFFFSFHCPGFCFSSKILCRRAIKRTHVLLSLAYFSEIYTKNVHTWAARNITWHYVSSYENVQNVNVLKARLKKKRKEREKGIILRSF